MPIQIRLTVLGHSGHTAYGPGVGGVDVQVTAPADTPLAAVLGPLTAAATPGSGAPGAVFCEDQQLHLQRHLLGRPPLVDGAVLAFHRPVTEPADVAAASARLLVVSGPDAGGVHLLRGGEVRVGRSVEADVPLNDPDVSRLHCTVAVGPDGSVTVTDLGSTNGTLLDGEPVTGGPVPVPPGALLRLGESTLRLVPQSVPQGGTAASAVHPPSPYPTPPGRRPGRRGLAGWARRRSGSPEERDQGRPPNDAVAGGQTAAPLWPDLWPDPADMLLTALEAGPRRWERDAGHPAAYAARLGTAQRTSGPLLPVAVHLPEAGSLGLAGPRERLAGVARSVLAQLAFLHPPSALELVVVATGRTEDWSWLAWLPHLRPTLGQDCRALLAFDRDQAAARLGELTARLAPLPAPPGRRTVVLVDGAPGDAALDATLARLASEGPAAGIHLLCLAETPPATPASPLVDTLSEARASSPAFRACGTVALLSGAVATAIRLVGPDGRPGPLAIADAVSAAWAERLARALAPVREEAAVPAGSGSALPEGCRHLDVLELRRVTPGALRERWTTAGTRLPLVLGAGPDGPLVTDLADGPGPLFVSGGPGSGRTELLCALAASLAVAQAPRDLSMLLVEGASESLRPCADLPHVASYLGAADPVRMREFAQALRAELKRRATLLGHADFGAARQRVGRPGHGPSSAGSSHPEVPRMLAEGCEPLPRLVVLVDDVDALLAPPLGAPGRQAAGSVVRALDSVAREGQRLGVHLVTAGTAVAGATTPEHWAVTRIALAGRPAGRAELLRPGGAAVTFQAGRVTGRIPRTATLRPTAVRLDWARAGDPPTRRQVRELGNGPTDVALLASAATRAAQTDAPTTTATLV